MSVKAFKPVGGGDGGTNKPYVASWEKKIDFKPDFKGARKLPKKQYSSYVPPPKSATRRRMDGTLDENGIPVDDSNVAVFNNYSNTLRGGGGSSKKGSRGLSAGTVRPQTSKSRRPFSPSAKKEFDRKKPWPYPYSSEANPSPAEQRTAKQQKERQEFEQQFVDHVLDDRNATLRRLDPVEWRRQRERMHFNGVKTAQRDQMNGSDVRYREPGDFPNSPMKRPFTSGGTSKRGVSSSSGASRLRSSRYDDDGVEDQLAANGIVMREGTVHARGKKFDYVPYGEEGRAHHEDEFRQRVAQQQEFNRRHPRTEVDSSRHRGREEDFQNFKRRVHTPNVLPVDSRPTTAGAPTYGGPDDAPPELATTQNYDEGDIAADLLPRGDQVVAALDGRHGPENLVASGGGGGSRQNSRSNSRLSAARTVDSSESGRHFQSQYAELDVKAGRKQPKRSTGGAGLQKRVSTTSGRISAATTASSSGRVSRNSNNSQPSIHDAAEYFVYNGDRAAVDTPSDDRDPRGPYAAAIHSQSSQRARKGLPPKGVSHQYDDADPVTLNGLIHQPNVQPSYLYPATGQEDDDDDDVSASTESDQQHFEDDRQRYAVTSSPSRGKAISLPRRTVTPELPADLQPGVLSGTTAQFQQPLGYDPVAADQGNFSPSSYQNTTRQQHSLGGPLESEFLTKKSTSVDHHFHHHHHHYSPEKGGGTATFNPAERAAESAVVEHSQYSVGGATVRDGFGQQFDDKRPGQRQEHYHQAVSTSQEVYRSRQDLAGEISGGSRVQTPNDDEYRHHHQTASFSSRPQFSSVNDDSHHSPHHSSKLLNSTLHDGPSDVRVDEPQRQVLHSSLEGPGHTQSVLVSPLRSGAPKLQPYTSSNTRYQGVTDSQGTPVLPTGGRFGFDQNPAERSVVFAESPRRHSFEDDRVPKSAARVPNAAATHQKFNGLTEDNGDDEEEFTVHNAPTANLW